MTDEALRRVAIGAAEPNWAGAVSAALADIGIDVVAVVAEPHEIPVVGIAAVVLAFEADGLRKGIEVLDVAAGVLAVGPDDVDLMVELLEAGVLGYLSDESGFDEIARAVEQLLDGHAVVPPAALGTLLRRVVERRRAHSSEVAALESLTPREREVFEHAACGRDNDVIGANLYISPATVRTHLQRVFKKLGIHSRAEAVAFAARYGLNVEGDT